MLEWAGPEKESKIPDNSAKFIDKFTLYTYFSINSNK